MTRMTEDQLLNSSLKELGYSIVMDRGEPWLKYEKDHTPTIKVWGIGIEIIPPIPEVNIENFGRFLAVFSRLPHANFYNSSSKIGHIKCDFLKAILIDSKLNKNYETSQGEKWPYCEITDSRWPDLEDKWKEYVKEVG